MKGIGFLFNSGVAAPANSETVSGDGVLHVQVGNAQTDGVGDEATHRMLLVFGLGWITPLQCHPSPNLPVTL